MFLVVPDEEGSRGGFSEHVMGILHGERAPVETTGLKKQVGLFDQLIFRRASEWLEVCGAVLRNGPFLKQGRSDKVSNCEQDIVFHGLYTAVLNWPYDIDRLGF